MLPLQSATSLFLDPGMFVGGVREGRTWNQQPKPKATFERGQHRVPQLVVSPLGEALIGGTETALQQKLGS